MQDVGGTEFLTLIKNAGLFNKIQSENVTIFVPSNDAVATYLTSHSVDSVNTHKIHIYVIFR